MKRNWLLVLVLFTLSTPMLWGQTQITGSGTENTVPLFTGTTTIGDSPILVFDGNVGIGTTPNSKLRVHNGSNSLYNGLQPYAVYATVDSDIDFSAALRGDATATSGSAKGIIGIANSSDRFSSGVEGIAYGVGGGGWGVAGVHDTALGGGGGGVWGRTGSTSGSSFGVLGESGGNGVGVSGLATGSNGVAGLFHNRAGGNILKGLTGANAITVFRVDGNGTVFAEGGFRPHGADFAESMPVSGSRNHYRPGDLMVIDPAGNQRLALSDKPYSTLVAGIYSTSPGVVGSQHPVEKPALDTEVPLAIVGIVPCNVTTENGSIAVGDLLVTSSAPGRAMKGTDRTRMLGAVVGKALEPLHSGNGVIQVLVTLQ